VFGRRRRQELEGLLQAARDRLDANAEQTAVLVDAVTALNKTIGVEVERTQRLEATADATTGALQHALSAQTADVSAALEHVASMYAVLAERIETDRLERNTLVQAVGQLARQLVLPEPTRPRVLGGSVFATAQVDARQSDPDDAGNRAAETAFAIGTDVCCRFGDQWIGGVEIVEIVDDSNRPTYRVRRHQDGYVLPALFNARDLRLAQPATADTNNEPRGRWARS
jgi:ABC-type transporter Mla subunit MlaD